MAFVLLASRAMHARLLLAMVVSVAAAAPAPAQTPALPRTADGHPDFHGIWQSQVRADSGLEPHTASSGLLAGPGVVEGGIIPYQPAAAAKRAQNLANRKAADPLEQCFMPGVPRIMYIDFPFQIFQTRDQVLMLFEWSQVYRVVYTNGTKPPAGIDFWMGDSRGHWEGDTLVVSVTNHNDKTWFDRAGDFHSAALTLVERYTMIDADTIRYEVTVDDPAVFTRPWKIVVPLRRQKDLDRLLEYQCNAEAEEVSGAFKPEPRTWYTPPEGRQ